MYPDTSRNLGSLGFNITADLTWPSQVVVDSVISTARELRIRILGGEDWWNYKYYRTSFWKFPKNPKVVQNYCCCQLWEETRSVYVTLECCLVGWVGVRDIRLGSILAQVWCHTFWQVRLVILTVIVALDVDGPDCLLWCRIWYTGFLLSWSGPSDCCAGINGDPAKALLIWAHDWCRPFGPAQRCCYQHQSWILLRQRGMPWTIWRRSLHGQDLLRQIWSMPTPYHWPAFLGWHNTLLQESLASTQRQTMMH